LPTTTTEGIIIKRKNFDEADRILTVITPYKGKLSVIAKGVRRMTSRRGGNVELLNKVRLHIFQGKGLSILQEAESIETFQHIKSELTLSAYGSHIIELIDRLVPEEQINPGVYKLVVTVLTLLDRHPRQLWIRAFEVKLLIELGFWDLKQLQVSTMVHQVLNDLENKDWINLTDLQVSSEVALELERSLRYYIEKILESPLRSIQVINKLKDESR
jgi:hypothetical protein